MLVWGERLILLQLRMLPYNLDITGSYIEVTFFQYKRKVAFILASSEPAVGEVVCIATCLPFTLLYALYFTVYFTLLLHISCKSPFYS